MTLIDPGIKAPLFSLPSTDGNRRSLGETLGTSSLVVVSFFKNSCPVCQMTFPFLERLHGRYPSVPIWGVSQDNIDETNMFIEKYGVTFPVVLDERLDSTADYDLVTVPSTFVIKADGVVAQTIYGFAKADFEELNTRIATALDLPAQELFTEDDDVPVLKPG